MSVVDNHLGIKIPLLLVFFLSFFWVLEGIFGDSLVICQSLGILSLFLLLIGIGISILKDPTSIVRPVIVFLLVVFIFLC
ncbi:hypothetical protein A946_00035 [Methylacidiphilum kamchatkense Kam1]|uniref:Uncharacterized protein n=1 Tax=Methylacidiphilum kamchatkense Kam1 TaxID=1202785 RepID=A0A0C1V607_9BACT|nr:hypothetical protein A946_00035 [Methylacidiphilum kamchatkense Kam1]QDQ42882.1 hypothetical protein kam1_1667 [Methylacidiphilum kamchatkense Kam1]